MVIDRVISQYLADKGRRIIVPGFGAFIRRDEGGLAFLPILKTDDGVLASEVSRRLNYSEAEAGETVRKYSDTLKNELSAGRQVIIKGVGTVSTNAAGKYVFESEESPHGADNAATSSTDRHASATDQRTPAAEKVVSNPELSERALTERISQSARTIAPEAAQKEPTPPAAKPAQPKPATPGSARPEPAPPALKSSIQGQRATVVTSSQSKPITTDYNINIRRPAKRKRMDTVLIIAIIAILAAVGVLVYGYVVGQGYTVDLNDMLQ